jgi:tripartite ATP-independent transporter DctM subunit
MFVVTFGGVHFAWALGIVGLLGMWLVAGPSMVAGQMATGAYGISSSYELATIPLFVLMGLFVVESGIGRDAFVAARIWVGRVTGALAIATAIANAFFGAVSGSSAAAAALFSKLAYPEMVKAGYDKRLAAGCIAASGTMAAMIPPSITLVIYGLLAKQSIGRLLIGGIGPGILECVTYMGLVYGIARLRPKYAPIEKIEHRLSFKQKVIKTSTLIPIGIIFLFAVGGIFFGIFAPTEGGAVGAAGALLIVLVLRRLSFRGFMTSLKETVQVTSMIMLCILGGYFFSRMLAITGLMQAVSNFVVTLPVAPIVVFSGIIVLLILAGMALVPVVMLIIFVPLLLPSVVSMGYDPIWFGIMFTRLIELGCITPPVALSVYMVKACIGDEISTMEVFQGCIPFMVADISNVILLYFFPQIALFLPGLMFD